MMRIAVVAAVLTLAAAAPAAAQIQLTAAAVGDGPYYLDQAGATYVLTEDVTVPAITFASPSTCARSGSLKTS